jgi:hypothetical protein
MPQSRGRFGRGRFRDDGSDPFGSSDADYDWLRYLGEGGPAQSTPRDHGGDTEWPARAPFAGRQHSAYLEDRQDGASVADRQDGASVADRQDAAARPSRHGPDRRASEVPGPADSGPRHGVAPDPATDYLPRTHRRQPGRSRREAARAPWAAERGWPTSPPAPSPERDADALTMPGGGPSSRPYGQPAGRSFAPSAEPVSGRLAQQSFAPPTERPSVRPSERSFTPSTEQPFGLPTGRPSGPAVRPDDRRVRGTGRPGAGHRRSTSAVDTGPETARSPIEQGKPRLQQRHGADRRASAPELETPTGPLRTATKDTVVTAPTTAQPTQRAARAKARRRHRTLLRVVGLVSAVAIVPATAAIVVRSGLLRSSGPDHTISVPANLMGYTLEPTLAKGMNAQALRADIVKKGNGEASHVVDGVYEDNAPSGTKSSPRIILFIGGNLAGSASSFIASFTGELPGAVATSAGKLGGQAACVPGTSGRPAECAWADNDTFGLFASPALSASALGKDMRAMRPLVEHLAKRG